jgi:glutamyl-tRNA reductase
MRILCIGTNYKSADVAVREKLAFDPEQRKAAMADLQRRWPEAEFVILSTCNRTELYAARPIHGHPREEELRSWLPEFHALPAADYDPVLYLLADAEATTHLFAVASGLDSLVTGEAQIVAQVKGAYGEAVEAGSAGAIMGELFRGALHVAKHIRTETDIALGKVSVASVAIDFVHQLFETLAGKSVLNIGAGKMNELMLRQLRGMGAERLVVVNRSRPKAETLAGACGGQAGDFTHLADHLAEADVVLTSTASPDPILSVAMVQAAQKRRGFRPLLIMDIAVPRDVEAAAGAVENVFLYNIDDLEKVIQANLATRHYQRGAAHSIITEHVEEVLAALSVRKVGPTIEALYRLADQIAGEELAEARNKLSTHADSKEDMEILQRSLRRAIRRFLNPCTQKLRQAAATSAARAHVAALRELFELDTVQGVENAEGKTDSDKSDTP